MTFLRTGMLATALAASTFAAAAPAEAHGRHGGDGAAIAIGAGVIGLAIGAAIASDDHDNRGYYQGGYYRSYPAYQGGYYYNGYPQYRGYQQYRSYPAYRGYDYRYQEQRRWREHERREHEEREHEGYWGGYRGW